MNVSSLQQEDCFVFRHVQDLATMVHEQGEVIDSIESNIESTTVQVASGTDQLRQVTAFRRVKISATSRIFFFRLLFIKIKPGGRKSFLH